MELQIEGYEYKVTSCKDLTHVRIRAQHLRELESFSYFTGGAKQIKRDVKQGWPFVLELTVLHWNSISYKLRQYYPSWDTSRFDIRSLPWDDVKNAPISSASTKKSENQHPVVVQSPIAKRPKQVPDVEDSWPDFKFEDVQRLVEHLKDFNFPLFEPTHDTQMEIKRGEIRDTSVILFIEDLKNNSVLLPMNEIVASHRTWKPYFKVIDDCIKSPVLIDAANLAEIRWMLTLLYKLHIERRKPLHDWLGDSHDRFMQSLLYRLNELTFAIEVEKGQTIYSLQESSGLYEDGTKYLGYMARDHGAFGSICSYDNYGDEASPEEHDNDWCDR